MLRMADDAHWAARALHDDWGDFVTNWDAQEVLGGVMAGCGPRAGLETRRRAVARSFTDW